MPYHLHSHPVQSPTMRPLPPLSLPLLLLPLLLLLSPSPCTSTSSTPLTLTGVADPHSYLGLTSLASAYQLLSPSTRITILPPPTLPYSSYASVLDQSVDFMSTTTLSLLSILPPPPILQPAYTLSALVPVYRLDSIPDTSPPLILSPSTLALIYMGNITHWNDSRLTALNPLNTLPSLPITVITEGAGGELSFAFTHALLNLYPPFAAVVPHAMQPAWPISSYAAWRPAFGVYTAVSAAVTLTNGAIGYTSYPTALHTAASIASLLTPAGTVVAPSPTSALLGAVEGIAQLSEKTPAFLDDGHGLTSTTLTNALGKQAWPMLLSSFFAFSLNATGTDCAHRALLFSFLSFVYQSQLAVDIITASGYTTWMSASFSIDTTIISIQQALLCDAATGEERARGVGKEAAVEATALGLLSSAPAPLTFTVSGDARFSSILPLLLNLFSTTQDSTASATRLSFTYTSPPAHNATAAVTALQAGDVDVAFIVLEELTTQGAQMVQEGVGEGGGYVLLPLFLYSVSALYSPQVGVNVSLPSSLTIDPATLAALFVRNITDWHDPALAHLNLSLPSSLLPVSMVAACDPVYGAYSLRNWLSFLAPYAPALLPLLSTPSSPLLLPCSSPSTLPYTTPEVTTEASTPSITRNLPGAVSFSISTSTPSTPIFSITFPPTSHSSSTSSPSSSPPLTPTTSSMLACLDAFDPSTLTIDTMLSANSSCYHFTRTVYALIPSSYTDTNADACADQRRLLQLLLWLASSSSLDPGLASSLFLRTSQSPAIQQAVTTALQGVQCIDPTTGDADTILTSLPVVWQLSRSVTAIGVALSSLALVATFAALTLTLVYRAHPAMRSGGSPLFLALTLLGLLLFFLGSLLLSLPPSAASCSAVAWAVSLGFMLTFAPLFAKAYRVYRIYGGTKLTVVKISNRRLAVLIAGLVAVELILLAVWQGVTPLQPLTITRTSGYPPRAHDYTQCSVDSGGGGMTLFVLLCCVHGVLLLWGALMSFSTRRVSEAFSESAGIAWSIYNVVLSAGVLVPVVLVIDAVGDTVVLLLTLGLLYIGAFTLTTIFLPRLTSLRSPPTTHTRHDADSGARESHAGFSFLSMASFTSGKALTAYLRALEQQVADAKTRYVRIKQGDRDGWRAGGGKGGTTAGPGKRVSTGGSPVPRHASPTQERVVSTTSMKPKPSVSYNTQNAISWTGTALLSNGRASLMTGDVGGGGGMGRTVGSSSRVSVGDVAGAMASTSQIVKRAMTGGDVDEEKEGGVGSAGGGGRSQRSVGESASAGVKMSPSSEAVRRGTSGGRGSVSAKVAPMTLPMTKSQSSMRLSSREGEGEGVEEGVEEAADKVQGEVQAGLGVRMPGGLEVPAAKVDQLEVTDLSARPHVKGEDHEAGEGTRAGGAVVQQPARLSVAGKAAPIQMLPVTAQTAAVQAVVEELGGEGEERKAAAAEAVGDGADAAAEHADAAVEVKASEESARSSQRSTGGLSEELL